MKEDHFPAREHCRNSYIAGEYGLLLCRDAKEQYVVLIGTDEEIDLQLGTPELLEGFTIEKAYCGMSREFVEQIALDVERFGTGLHRTHLKGPATARMFLDQIVRTDLPVEITQYMRASAMHQYRTLEARTDRLH